MKLNTRMIESGGAPGREKPFSYPELTLKQIYPQMTQITQIQENKNLRESAPSADSKTVEVFFVDGNALVACFDACGNIDENLVRELAQHQPLRVVFRDAGFASDSVKINVEQIFKLLSPGTEVKCI